MPYVSLYRKYRPQTFDDVVGQDHVTTTLRNAIAAGRIASGYLFCGTRGTAKTTCARILAKALNCVGPDGARRDMTPEPCGVCEPCKAIAASSFVDVLELDAASHGKVDDVRDLVASIKYPPIEGRFKVYIIDEAHQLSRDAMDAFLKTLEEPPNRCVFVLATTELEKLPITIASRCQVYEFKRGSVPQIAGRLQKVLEQEGVTGDPAAVALVARAAEGSYRDSLSLLEQVLAFKPDNITPADVTTVLGAVDEDILDRIVQVIAAGDAAGGFSVVADLLSAGKDVRQVLRTVSERFRDLLAVRVGASSRDTEIAESPSLQRHAKLFSPAALLRILGALSEAERDIRWNTQHRLLLETTLLRLMDMPQEAPAAHAQEPATRPAAASAPQTPRAERSADAPESHRAERPANAPEVQRAARTAPPSPVEPQPVAAAAPPTAQAQPARQPAASASPSAGHAAGAPFDEDDDPDDEDLSSVLDMDDDLVEAPAPSSRDLLGGDDLLQLQQVTVAEAPAAAPPARPAAAPGQPALLHKLQRSWQEVINRMTGRSPSGGTIVRDATPILLDGNTFVLRFSSRFHIDRLEGNDKGRKALEEIVNKTLDAAPGTYRIKCVLAGQEPTQPARPQTTRSHAEAPPAPAPSPEPDSDLVEDVIAVFGGRVIEDDAKGY